MIIGQALLAISSDSSVFSTLTDGHDKNFTPFNLALISRAMYGLGNDWYGVTQSTLISNNFNEKEFSLAMGISIGNIRLGSDINDFVSLWVSNQYGFTIALWFGFLINSICTLFGITYIILHHKFDKKWRSEVMRNNLLATPSDSYSSNILVNDDSDASNSGNIESNGDKQNKESQTVRYEYTKNLYFGCIRICDICILEFVCFF